MVTQAAKELVWDKVRDENCTRCPLHESAQSVCLLGDGPVPSKIMAIGEAPGFREDEIKKPFSGAAGQYLDSVLSEVGLPRDLLYITNAARCRPPENRTPTRGEIKACSVFTQAELKIVEPEYILLLGNVALQSMTGSSGIMKKRGAAMTVNGRTLFPTVHPAAVLRNPALGPTFKSDLLAFRRLVHGESKKPVTVSKLIKNSRSLRILCDMLVRVKTPIAFDVETWAPGEEGGLRPWHPEGKILTVSFTWEEGKSYVVAIEHPEAQWDVPIQLVYDALAVVLEDKEMIGHNAKFDMHWMRSKGITLRTKFDTLLAAHLLDENRPNGLKSLARSYLGADSYEAGIEFNPGMQLSKLAIYNGRDTDYTFRLYHIFRKDLMEHERLARLFKFILMPACNSFVEMERTGFPIDISRLQTRHSEILKKIKDITTQLLEFCPVERRMGANLRSPVFLGWFFFEHLGLPILELGAKSGRPSTKEAVLLKLKNQHPAAALLMELRKYQKYESTYTRNWIARLKAARRPRLFTSYNLAGTITGRLSSNMQQVPRDNLIRSIIGSRPGWKFIEGDFAQIELRIAAMLSNDPALIRAFNTGGDPHRETAAGILNKPLDQVTKEERKMAKAVNFGFLYGMGAKKFMTYADEKYDTKVTLAEAQAYRKAFFDHYKALVRWHERQRRLVHEHGLVQSPIGRVRHLPQIRSSDEFMRAEAERDAINAPVQGLASDFTVLAMVLLNEKLDKKKARIIGNVHDAILLEARDEYAEEAARLTKETMENLPLKRLFGWSPTVPIEAEVTIGTHWGEKEV